MELVVNRKDNKLIYALINASGYFGNSFFSPIPMSNIMLHIPEGYTKATALNGGCVCQTNGTVCLDKLYDFEMIVLEQS